MPDPKATATDRLDLLSILRELPDPRVERTRLHKFEDILLIAICALLCGAESFEDMELFGDTKEPWLRTFLELPNGIPSVSQNCSKKYTSSNYNARRFRCVNPGTCHTASMSSFSPSKIICRLFLSFRPLR